MTTRPQFDLGVLDCTGLRDRRRLLGRSGRLGLDQRAHPIAGSLVLLDRPAPTEEAIA